ncbi:MAG TPA: aminoglycoside phosphotransferase family protein [Myxococcaceae bacterium]|nr:aminoglycoside phosphotransferase family protein [Myxococcaceae bacterium]
MSVPRISLPEVVRQKARSLGAPGEAWLEGLPDLVRDLERAWSLKVLQALPGGSTAYVARVQSRDGQDCVLKIALPGLSTFAHELQILRAAAGRGYVRLWADDPRRSAMLQERLGRSLEETQPSIERQISITCRSLQAAWNVPIPPELQLITGETKARQLQHLIRSAWQELSHPCSEEVVTQALRFADSRAEAHGRQPSVLVHGDPHGGNVLARWDRARGTEDDSDFKLIDPEAFRAEPAYDLGVVMRDWSAPLLQGATVALAQTYCRRLSQATGVDETAVWEWGFLERVSTGLYALQFGAEGIGRPMLEVAEQLA